MGNLKNLLVRALLRFSSRAMRSRLPRSVRRLYWDKVCAPYLCWRSLDIECRTRFGFRMMVRPKEFVENRIGFFGIWEPPITSLFTELVRPGSVVVDVGANVGYFSLLASRLVGAEGKVYAVEPSPSIRARLSDNLRLNNITNVIVLPYAAWNESGEATLYVASQDVGNSTLSAQRAYRSTEPVQLARLDELIPKQEFPRISLVKVDVEGAEHHALEGMTGMLQSNERIALIVEISPSVIEEFGSSSQALLELLGDLGYEGYGIANDYSVEAYLSGAAKAPLQSLAIDPTQIIDALFIRKERLAASSVENRVSTAPIPTFSGPPQS